MVVPPRRICPSCQHGLSALAAECPECGLTLAPPQQPGRRMLFQATALAQASFEPPARALMAPALGRVTPVAVEVSPEELVATDLPPLALAPAEPATPAALGFTEHVTSFTPLLWVELSDALLLAVVQGLALTIPALALGISPLRLASEAWVFVIPYLLVVSWFLFMAPLLLIGQTPCMGLFGVALPENAPHRRAIYSLAHLVSVCCFPISLLCMLLGERHQTLAEILTGQELLALPTPRLR